MPSGLAHGSSLARWSRCEQERALETSEIDLGEVLRNAHRASSSRTRPRKPSASTPMAHESSTSVTVFSPGLPASTTYDAPAARSAATRSAPHSAYAASVPARQTTGWPRVGRRHRLHASRSHRPPRRRPRRRRAGWWRRWRARCARRSGPSWPGTPVVRRAGRAGPRRRCRSGCRRGPTARARGVPRPGSGTPRSPSAAGSGRRCHAPARRGRRATRSFTPRAACSPKPPSASIRPSSAHPATARSSVSFSTA